MGVSKTVRRGYRLLRRVPYSARDAALAPATMDGNGLPDGAVSINDGEIGELELFVAVGSPSNPIVTIRLYGFARESDLARYMGTVKFSGDGLTRQYDPESKKESAGQYLESSQIIERGVRGKFDIGNDQGGGRIANIIINAAGYAALYAEINADDDNSGWTQADVYMRHVNA